MPLYEYKCETCGDVFEVMQKFSDAPVAEHSNCGGKVHRLVSASALQFKGSGWYINDYAKGSGSSPNGGSKKDDGGSKASSSPSSEGGGDSKPATTSSTSSDTKSKS